MIGWSVDDVTREGARRAARDELSRSEYHRDDPSLTQRVIDWVYDKVRDGLETLAANTPGGGLGLLGLVVLAALLVVALRLRTGPLARTAARGSDLFAGAGELSAAQHRRNAEAAAAAGEWGEAVRERLRALVRSLEERSLLEPRAGRTADEAAAEAARLIPEAGALVVDAARSFDEIWYGGRPATSTGYERVRSADDAVTAARPSLHGSPL